MPSFQELKSRSAAQSKRGSKASEDVQVTAKGTIPGRALYDKSPEVVATKRVPAPTQTSLQYRKEREIAHRRVIRHTQKQQEQWERDEEENEQDEGYEERRQVLLHMIIDRDGIDYGNTSLEELQEVWDDPDADAEEENNDGSRGMSDEQTYPNIRIEEPAPVKKHNKRSLPNDDEEGEGGEEVEPIAPATATRPTRPVLPLTRSSMYNSRAGAANDIESGTTTPAPHSSARSPLPSQSKLAKRKIGPTGNNSSTMSSTVSQKSAPPPKRRCTDFTVLDNQAEEDEHVQAKRVRKPKPKAADYERTPDYPYRC